MGWEKILVISDLHVGSRYAVMPETFNGYEASNLQKKILERWVDMVKKETDIDALFILGDVVDGFQRANRGRELWTADIDEQIDAAVELVKMIDYDKALVVYGSPYHTDDGLIFDEVFAKRIGAVEHDWELIVKPNNVEEYVHIAHNVSVSNAPMMYRTTPIAKELMLALLHEKELGRYKTVIRGHAHYFVYVAFSNQFGWVNPCWQARTPYMIRSGLSLVPKLGYVVFNTPENGRWSIEPKTFSIPRPNVVSPDGENPIFLF